jgi:hypothetical protein
MLNRTEIRQPVLTVAAFAEVPYSPALLLESSFDASVTDSDEFHLGCKWGFDAYFDTMYELGASKAELVFVEKHYTWAEIVEFVIQTVLGEDPPGYVTLRAWRAGFGLGWLSALALTNRREARMGLTMLTTLLVGPASERKVAA